jgi:acetyl-CoA C-acetyltransferase
VCSLDRARELSQRQPVQVLGIAQTSDWVALERKEDITTFESVRTAAQKAYGMAALGPERIDVAEVHDCFTIAEIVAVEDLGFVGKGQGGPWSAEGCSALDGEKPVNTSGGLKAKGHPVGATGVGQICDLVLQLRGEAGERQVPGRHEIGLAQNLGGSGASCVVTIVGVA